MEDKVTNEEIYNLAHQWADDFTESEELGGDLANLLLDVRKRTVEEFVARLELLGNHELAMQIRQEYE